MPETFKRETKYGLTVLTTTDEGLLRYLNQIVTQVQTWLMYGDVQRLVVVVTGDWLHLLQSVNHRDGFLLFLSLLQRFPVSLQLWSDYLRACLRSLKLADSIETLVAT